MRDARHFNIPVTQMVQISGKAIRSKSHDTIIKPDVKVIIILKQEDMDVDFAEAREESALNDRANTNQELR